MRRRTAADLLTSQKGHYGGFQLAKAPSEIRFIDILRAVEFDPGLEHCLFGWDECGEDDPCPLHQEWTSLKDCIEQWAQTRTLGEVVGRDISPHRARQTTPLVGIGE